MAKKIHVHVQQCEEVEFEVVIPEVVEAPIEEVPEVIPEPHNYKSVHRIRREKK